MASLETVSDFLAQYHDVIRPDEASAIVRESRRYLVGGLIPRGTLGFVFASYLPLFIRFEADKGPEVPEPGHRGAI